jgi:acetyl esterase/lipase
MLRDARGSIRRFAVAAVLAAATALLAACSPLSLFATLSPKDPAIRSAQDVAFGPGPRQRLDVYAPEHAAGPAPVAVYFYGGSWTKGRRQDYRWIGEALASRGFLAVIPDYRLYPRALYPAFLQDGALAVRWVTEHAAQFGGDPRRIVLIGHSAGAYNAVMIGMDTRYLAAVGVDPGRIKAVAGLSGPYDFLPLHDDIASRVFGKARNLPATQPLAYVGREGPPAFLATGDDDTEVAPRNTTSLAAALRKAGAIVEEHHYPGLGHGRMVLALSRPLRGGAPVLEQMTAFLHKYAD